MRHQGKSVPEIAKLLGRGKSTIFFWVRKKEYSKLTRTEALRQGREKAVKALVRKWQSIRDESYCKGYSEAPIVLQDPTIRDFIVMYLAEGYKKSRSAIDFTNTDASIIKLFVANIKRFTPRDPRYVLIGHKVTEDMINFWAKQLGIPSVNISVVEKGGNVNPKRANNGTFKVVVNDTKALFEIKGLYDYLREKWSKEFAPVA